MPQLTTYNDIIQYMPHRYENVLLDHVTIESVDAIKTTTLALTLNQGDHLNRDIFLQRISPEQPAILMETLFVEILALAMIAQEGPIPKDIMVFFASITDFTYHHSHPEALLLTGHIKSLMKRKRFFKCKGVLLQDHRQPIAEAQLMASVISESDPKPPDTTPPPWSLPKSNCHIPTDKTLWQRHPDLVICDALIYIDSQHQRCISQYNFTTHHPLIKGHFPELPVMMGVLQWQGVADTCLALAQRLAYTGRHTLTCQATMYKKTGAVVNTISGCTIVVSHQESGFFDHTQIRRTDKVAFKNRVVPGDTLFIDVQFNAPFGP